MRGNVFYLQLFNDLMQNPPVMPAWPLITRHHMRCRNEATWPWRPLPSRGRLSPVSEALPLCSCSYTCFHPKRTATPAPSPSAPCPTATGVSAAHRAHSRSLLGAPTAGRL